MPKSSLLRSSLLTEHRLVTDRQTDRQTDIDTDTGPQMVPALAQRRAAENGGTCLRFYYTTTPIFVRVIF